MWSSHGMRTQASRRESCFMARLTLLALLLGAAAGCAGGRAARPALPEGTVAIPVLLAEADSTAASGNPADARSAYARAARAAARAGSKPLEIRAQLGAGLTSLALADAESPPRALARDPGHAPSLEALSALSESRYLAAGLPEGYAALRAHSSVSRGELGVMLAAELGADPERPSWHGAKEYPSDTEEARGAW